MKEMRLKDKFYDILKVLLLNFLLITAYRFLRAVVIWYRLRCVFTVRLSLCDWNGRAVTATATGHVQVRVTTNCVAN
jgi:hypothetical protein